MKFDSRKDLTVQPSSAKSVRLSHLTIVSEPGSEFLEETTLPDGTGETCANELHYTLKMFDSVDEFRCAGSDGTAANTGESNGAIKRLEDKVNRAVFWAICLLHLNELILKTSGLFDQK